VAAVEWTVRSQRVDETRRPCKCSVVFGYGNRTCFFRWYLQRWPPSEPAGYGVKSCLPHLTVASHHTSMALQYARTRISLSVPVHRVQHAWSQKVRETLAGCTDRKPWYKPMDQVFQATDDTYGGRSRQTPHVFQRGGGRGTAASQTRRDVSSSVSRRTARLRTLLFFSVPHVSGRYRPSQPHAFPENSRAQVGSLVTRTELEEETRDDSMCCLNSHDVCRTVESVRCLLRHKTRLGM
jgi:hypothetical protein